MRRLVERAEPLVLAKGEGSVSFAPDFGVGRLRIFVSAPRIETFSELSVSLACLRPGRESIEISLGRLSRECEEWEVPSLAVFRSYELVFTGGADGDVIDLIVVEEEALKG